MRNMQSEINKRELRLERDKEFLELYRPTLDALLQKGMTESKARRAAAEFTVANGHPHYHVDHERAYRCVCHLINADQKHAHNARSYRTGNGTGLPKRRLRQQMWYEITSRVSALTDKGMSISEAIDHVLEHCRASRFFITPVTALTKICTNVNVRALR